MVHTGWFANYPQLLAKAMNRDVIELVISRACLSSTESDLFSYPSKRHTESAISCHSIEE